MSVRHRYKWHGHPNSKMCKVAKGRCSWHFKGTQIKEPACIKSSDLIPQPVSLDLKNSDLFLIPFWCTPSDNWEGNEDVVHIWFSFDKKPIQTISKFNPILRSTKTIIRTSRHTITSTTLKT